MVIGIIDTSMHLSHAELACFVDETRGIISRSKDWRAVKKFERSITSLVNEAYNMGGEAAYNGRPNPFPRGKRHNEFERGYANEKAGR